MKHLRTVLVLLSTVGTVVAHVALTFPPARKYNLDFLDNSRTKAPCGMPKGDIVTTLPAGVKINITWHLAYPHKGGFKLELLGKNERHLLDLTHTTAESNYIGADDTTAQSFAVHLPQALSCKGCSVRLLRQAKEWGSNYLFWSCADVDIVPVTEFNTVCSGRGKLVNHLCACNRLHSGNVCQYQDECWSDEDCGSHGKCINVEATTYPKMQCFCQTGWFGEKCSKESSVKTTNLDLAQYNSKVLSEKYILYWRILQETEEIEAVLQAESTSYLALGWRPQGITSKCKAFPLVVESRKNNLRYLHSDDTPIQQHENHNFKWKDTESDLKFDSEGKSNAEGSPEPNIEGEPKPSTKENSEPNSGGEPEPIIEEKKEQSAVEEPESSAKGKLEPSAEGEPELSTIRETEPSAKGEPEPTTIGEPEPSTEGEPEPSAEGEPEPSTIGEPEPSAKGEPEPSAEGEPEPSTIGEPEPSAEGEPEPSTLGEPYLSNKENSEPTREKKSESKVTEESSQNLEVQSELNVKEDSKSGVPVPPSKAEPESSTKAITGTSELVAEGTLEPTAKGTPEFDFEKEKTSNTEKQIVYIKPSSTLKNEQTSKSTIVGVPLGVGPSDGLERKFFVYNNRFRRQAILPEPSDLGSIPEPDSEPNPKSEGEMNTEHDAHLEPEPRGSGEPEPGSITTSDSKGKLPHQYPSSTAYTPRFDFHPMDCSDIVIGAARGKVSRVFDYYTRDRSTPRVDSFYGGSDTLTAAIGFEEDGRTTILFRKKIKAEEFTDHTIENAPMDIIWALGQEPGHYVHRPSTGLESGNAKVPDFYKPDEIKYHGHSHQRGKTTLNFYEQKVESKVKEETENKIEGCAGEWKYPRQCEGSSCEYVARWYFHEKSDEMYFRISSTHPDKWTGIGFSKDMRMANSDAVIGWVSSNGKVSVFDSWLTGYSHPEYDLKQSVYNITGELLDGTMTIQFIRKRNTGDATQDLLFSDGECVYFIFPVRGGQYDNAFKQVTTHETTPFVSLVCIQSCSLPVILNQNKEVQAEPAPEPKSKPKSEEEPNSEPEPSSEPEPEPNKENMVQCMGEWKSPVNCDGYGCDYKAMWKYVDKSDEIAFTISTKNHNKWTGIAFSKNREMEATDAILGWVEESGRFFIMDTWLTGYRQPLLDPSQSISNVSGWREDGVTTLKFSRKRYTGDLERDLHFTDNECLFMFFPVHGGVFNAVNKKIRQHESTPKISEKKVCIKSCKSERGEVVVTIPTPKPTTLPKPVSKLPKIRRPVLHFPAFRTPNTPLKQTTTAATSIVASTTSTVTTISTQPSTTLKPTLQKMKYIVEVKLPLSWNSELKRKESTEYITLKKQILENMNVTLTSFEGFEGVEVTKLASTKGDNGVIAQMNVIIMDKPLLKESHQLEDNDNSVHVMKELSMKLNETIKKGYIGTLQVDPAYLKIQSASRVQELNPNEIPFGQGTTNLDSSGDGNTKVYIIIGGIAALVLLVAIQASCMIYRDRRNCQTSHVKEKLINSHWKDYATASSNYSYENFGMQEEDGKVSKHPIGSVSNGSAVSKKSAVSHPSANGKSSGRSGNIRPLPPAGQSHTLERMSSRHSDGFSNMSGYSNAYATHDRSLRSTSSTLRAQQELQPDFYFMPHQRRYSGEVVRVFVDYSNPEYTGK
ncbi:uncharacterized protein LOC143223350 [Tachypleus tridentatus]|uniref:uncharacterized protein LOC143223350 n=1 Tax=Tachypleus tridentatus TaxID=6853 RepID=UPI003FD2C3A7